MRQRARRNERTDYAIGLGVYFHARITVYLAGGQDEISTKGFQMPWRSECVLCGHANRVRNVMSEYKIMKIERTLYVNLSIELVFDLFGYHELSVSIDLECLADLIEGVGSAD